MPGAREGENNGSVLFQGQYGVAFEDIRQFKEG